MFSMNCNIFIGLRQRTQLPHLARRTILMVFVTVQSLSIELCYRKSPSPSYIKMNCECFPFQKSGLTDSIFVVKHETSLMMQYIKYFFTNLFPETSIWIIGGISICINKNISFTQECFNKFLKTERRWIAIV